MTSTGPGLEESRLELDIRATRAKIAEARRLVVGFAAVHGADDDTRAEIALSASEAMTNALLHGYDGDPSGQIHVVVECEDDAIEITVGDDGRGMRMGGHSDGLGLGLALIARAAARFKVRGRSPRGTEVWMRFHL